MTTVVQTKSTDSDGSQVTTLNATFTSNVTAGNFLILMVVDVGGLGDTPSVSDTLGNTWTKDTGLNSSGCGIWTAPSPSGGADTVTISSIPNNFVSMTIIEVSGLGTPTKANQSNSNGSTQSISVTAIDFSSDSIAVACSFQNNGGTYTGTTGFTTNVSSANIPAITEWLVESSSGSETFSISTTAAAAFMGEAAGVYTPPTSVFRESGAKRQYRRLGAGIR